MTGVRIWFYDPRNDVDGILNKLIAYADPPFCHCEVQFEDDMACSIYMGTNVVFKQRQFDRADYTSIYLTTTHDNAQKAYTLCRDAAQHKTPFSSLQMLSCISPWHWTPNSKATYCSKLVAGILIDSGIVPQNMNRAPTPSQLHRNLKSLTTPESHVHDVIDFIPDKNFKLRI